MSSKKSRKRTQKSTDRGADQDRIAPATTDTRQGWTLSGRGRIVALALLFILALTGHWIYVYQQEQHNPLFYYPSMDEEYHDQWAESIRSGTAFNPGQPYFRAPLYPYFLAGLYQLFDRDLFRVRLGQAVIGSISAILVTILASFYVAPVWALIAGLIAALYGPLVYFDSLLLIPVLIVFLDLLFLILLQSALRSEKSYKRARFFFSAAGLCCGLSAIARPNILLFVPAFGLVYLFSNGLNSFKSRQNWTTMLLFGSALLLVILPITIRNYIVSGEYVLIASQGGVNFFIGNNAHSDGKTAILPNTRPDWKGGYEDSRALVRHALGRDVRDSEISDYYYAQALRYIRTEFGSWLGLMGRKILYLLGSHEISNNYSIRFITGYSPIYRYFPFSFGLIAPLGLIGLFLLAGKDRTSYILPLFFLIYSCSIVMFFVNARYRIPLVPLLIIGLVYVLEKATGLVKARKGVALVLIGAAVAACGLLVNRDGQPEYDPAQDHYILGVHYTRIKNTDRAIQEYQKALELAPRWDTPAYNLAIQLEETGRLDEAQQYYRLAFSNNPGNWEAAHRSSKLELRAHNVRAALDWAKRAVAAQPLKPENHYLEGHCYMALARYEEAEKSFQNCLEQDKNDLNCRIYLAVSLLEQSQEKQAVALLEQVLEQDPDNILARRFLDMVE
ncbi:tetratricopeptide repeat protein [bacterium]|nr:tetratricopeptide repeat protein [bacterium]